MSGDPLDRLYAEETKLVEQLRSRRHLLVGPWDSCTDAVMEENPEVLAEVLRKIARRGALVVETLQELRRVRRHIDLAYMEQDDDRHR